MHTWTIHLAVAFTAAIAHLSMSSLWRRQTTTSKAVLPEVLWMRNSTEWESELETIEAESSCLDRRTLCPTYRKPFELFARATETGEWRREWDSNPR
jgi:hypothetical protein